MMPGEYQIKLHLLQLEKDDAMLELCDDCLISESMSMGETRKHFFEHLSKKLANGDEKLEGLELPDNAS
jgi:hypothetical protein